MTSTSSKPSYVEGIRFNQLGRRWMPNERRWETIKHQLDWMERGLNNLICKGLNVHWWGRIVVIKLWLSALTELLVSCWECLCYRQSTCLTAPSTLVRHFYVDFVNQKCIHSFRDCTETFPHRQRAMLTSAWQVCPKALRLSTTCYA